MAKRLSPNDVVSCRLYNAPDSKFYGDIFKALIITCNSDKSYNVLCLGDYVHTLKVQRKEIIRRIESLPTDMIVLYNFEGIARLSGVDQYGNSWIEFNTDYFAEQNAEECAICSDVIEYGWLCLDGADVVCDNHVMYAKDI